MKKNKLDDNLLDYIPEKNDELRWEEDEGVVLFVENRGWANFIAQKFFHRPRFSQIHLDEMGSFIWRIIDGNRSIYDISILVKEEFGDNAEPLYNRLVQYMRTLEAYSFIKFKNR